ncbi:ferric reduction oxidase 2-like [Vicia villosa]|uniref:ferric reduction oxidase 2-like n=1 Tax=Vicia villosa TaxID=3911 RepID=UPI00273AA9FD|nr:ferric reduction oxidase 2-like [Vicia villosa]
MAQENVKRSPSQIKYTMAKSIIRLFVFLLFLGLLFIFIMTPTSTYKHKWVPKIQAKSNSTYFGVQGFIILIYTFPSMLIATLGCVYIHITKKSNEVDNGKKHESTIWKRPLLVKGPLGIVSMTEIAFLLMLMALLVWTLANYIHNDFLAIASSPKEEDGPKIWQEKLAIVGFRLGPVGNICLVLLFFPVTRGTSVLPMFGLTSEGCIKYHIWKWRGSLLVGHVLMTAFTAHGVCFIIFWASTNQISQMLKWDKVGISNVAGEISLLAGLFLWVATIPKIRRKFFELFFYTHNLYIIFIIFFVFHIGIYFSYIMLPGFYLFMVDRYLRFLQSRRKVRLVSSRVLPCEGVELNFSKGHELSYNPTSVMFINVPSISKLQWHPFTITSNSNLEQDKLSVVIKSEGTWTQKLYQLLSNPSPIDRLQISVEGPYGPPSTNYLRHDTIVMISGGSGITPFISIIRDLIYLSTTFKCKTPNILLICSFNNTSSLSMLELILPISSTPQDISNMKLQIEAYITRDQEFKPDIPIHPQTLWFKPNPTDTPIHAILGLNSWIWLSLIISSSFIIFLIIIGIITRYYIFPIDHNTNTIFSYPLRSFLHMLIICVSVVVVASVAVLSNKKQNAKEAKQIQNMERPTPIVSPNSMIYNADREMESFPYQSLVQATNVTYGARPDLSRLLLEIKGSSVGVFASGPKQLRQNVATICSSGLVENLHFESISFTW